MTALRGRDYSQRAMNECNTAGRLGLLETVLLIADAGELLNDMANHNTLDFRLSTGWGRRASGEKETTWQEQLVEVQWIARSDPWDSFSWA